MFYILKSTLFLYICLKRYKVRVTVLLHYLTIYVSIHKWPVLRSFLYHRYLIITVLQFVCFSTYVTRITTLICYFAAPAAGGPPGQTGQLAPGAVAVPGQIGLLQPQQPALGQQPLDLPSK